MQANALFAHELINYSVNVLFGISEIPSLHRRDVFECLAEVCVAVGVW